MAEKKVLRFQDLHDVVVPPEAEGWERMYSPAYQVTPKGGDPERAKYESERFWLQDSLHQPPVPWPMSTDLYDTTWWPRIAQMNTNVFCFPGAAGLDKRMLGGYVYLSSNVFTDPEQIAEREKLFLKRVGYYFEHWDEGLENLRKKQMATSKAIEELTFEELPDIVPESDITEFKGTYGYTQMEKNWRRAVDLWEEGFDVHFEMFNIAHAAHLAFSGFCDKAFPGIGPDTIAKMISGVGGDVYRPDEEVQALARLALELGVADAVLQSGDWTAVEARLNGTDAGRKWLKDLEGRKYPWFYFTTGYSIITPLDRAWVEDMNAPLALMRDYIPKMKAGEAIGMNSEALKREAGRIASEYSALLKGEERPVFDQLRLTDRKAAPHIEGHMFWFECLHNYAIRTKLDELGTIFANCGLMDEPGDIWYLRLCEVEELIKDYIRCKTTFPPGGKPQSIWYWPKEIRWRKKVCQILAEWRPPECLGVAPEEILDPFYIGLWGVTTEKVALWHQAAAVEPEEITELSAFPAAPGVVEGTARVLVNVSLIDEVKPGEILVCRTTAPSWGPVFGKIKAVVTDVGGMMCHSAIVSREYGIPAVTGVGFGTRVFKTGDVIRVSGDEGKVTIVRRVG